jgi:hypothetical protein
MGFNLAAGDLMSGKVKRRPHEFVIRLGPGKYAYLEYRVKQDALHIDSTFTPEEYRGRGLARKLTEAAIEYARQKSLKIVPNCGYAKYYFEEHPKYRELLTS